MLDAGYRGDKTIDPAIRSSATYRRPQDQAEATDADLVEAAKRRRTATALLRIGDRYYAMGNYAKAVELYRMSMGKPGADADVANLHLGMALGASRRQGRRDRRVNAVTGPGPRSPNSG